MSVCASRYICAPIEVGWKLSRPLCEQLVVDLSSTTEINQFIKIQHFDLYTKAIIMPLYQGHVIASTNKLKE